MLYSKNGAYPGPLPYRIRLSDGSTRTGDPSNFTANDIASAGYVAVVNPPEIRSNQYLGWNSERLSWLIETKSDEQLNEELSGHKASFANTVDLLAGSKILNGFSYANTVFQADSTSQFNITVTRLRFVSKGGIPDYPNPWGWWDIHNNVHSMTETSFNEFALAMDDWVRSIKVIARRKKDNILKANSNAALHSYLATYPLEEGWPS